MLDEIVDYVKFLRLQVKVIMYFHECVSSIKPYYMDIPCFKKFYSLLISSFCAIIKFQMLGHLLPYWSTVLIVLSASIFLCYNTLRIMISWLTSDQCPPVLKRNQVFNLKILCKLPDNMVLKMGKKSSFSRLINILAT